MKKSNNKKFKTIKIDLTDSELLRLSQEAHKQNKTFNQLCSNFLEDYIKKSKESS